MSAGLPAAGVPTWDVVVVGAGPAGSIAARELARAGARVLLAERARLPRDKVCGGCVHPRLVARLTELGLADLLARLGAVPTTRVRLAAGRRVVALAARGGVAVSRRALDAALADAAVRAGVELCTDAPARLAPLAAGAPPPATRALEVASERVAARVVVAATGLGAPLADGIAERVRPGSRIGAGALLPAGASAGWPPGELTMACDRAGYVGVVRLEDGALDVAAALDPAAVRAADGPGPLAAAILARRGLPAIAGLEAAAWRGTPALTRRAEAVARARVVRVGDAAGYVEPFTGEGMSWAVESALAATPLVLRALEEGWSPALERAFERARAARVGRRARRAALIARALRSPRLVGALAGGLARLPGLAAPLAARLVDRPLEAGPPAGTALPEGAR